VTIANSDKWQRYEHALLLAMGYDPFPSAATTDYQLLIIPTFHAPCCLRLTLARQCGELSFSFLLAHVADLPDASWREDAQAEAQMIALARRSCRSDIALLTAAQADGLQQRLAALEPATLGNIDLASRDGVHIRYDYCDADKQHTSHMSSPTAQDAPRHMGLISVLLDAAQAHFDHPQIAEYLVALRRYLR
jgi:hypothetical protein